MYIQATKVLR